MLQELHPKMHCPRPPVLPSTKTDITCLLACLPACLLACLYRPSVCLPSSSSFHRRKMFSFSLLDDSRKAVKKLWQVYALAALATGMPGPEENQASGNGCKPGAETTWQTSLTILPLRVQQKTPNSPCTNFTYDKLFVLPPQRRNKRAVYNPHRDGGHSRDTAGNRADAASLESNTAATTNDRKQPTSTPK